MSAIAAKTSLSAALLPISGHAISQPPEASASALVRRPCDVLQQFTTIEWLHHERGRSVSQCLSADVIVVVSGDEDDRQTRAVASGATLQFKAVDSGQTNVCYHTHHL